MDTSHQIKNNQFDTIIIGQGIAGSVLALSLIENGKSVLVIDDPNLSNSSKASAGVWNPVVFKRLTKSWLADELIDELEVFYKRWEEKLNCSFIINRHIIKSFVEEQELIFWKKKSIEGNNFLDSTIYQNYPVSNNYTEKNYSKVLRAGNVNLPVFLKSVKEYLIKNNSYLNEKFNKQNLVLLNDGVSYNNYTSKNIILCEGHLITKCPFFNWVEMKPVKGETLTIHCNDLILKNDIFNKGVFIMPLGDNNFKIGATYNWNDINDEPTEEGKYFLSSRFSEAFNIPFTILNHQAGVRPSVIDRRPVIGAHPIHKNLFVFNGFGTKAVMLTPYFAKQLNNFIQNNSIINCEVDVNRFYKK